MILYVVAKNERTQVKLSISHHTNLIYSPDNLLKTELSFQAHFFGKSTISTTSFVKSLEKVEDASTFAYDNEVVNQL